MAGGEVQAARALAELRGGALIHIRDRAGRTPALAAAEKVGQLRFVMKQGNLIAVEVELITFVHIHQPSRGSTAVSSAPICFCREFRPRTYRRRGEGIYP
eukprot:1181943-Prorocentrum_minimum.AAC.1